MKTIEIKAVSREQIGKKSTKELRNENNVPCVMYGGKETIHFYAHENVFRGLVYTPDVHLVKLVVEDKTYSAVMKELQFHPVTDKLQHIDFMEVFDEKPVTIAIPVKISGESAGIKAGGKLKVKRRNLKVKALAKDLPDHLTIDISKLGIGQSIKIGDLSYDNLEIIDNKRAMIVSIATSRLAVKGEGTEAEAPAAAPEGETPAEE